MANAKHLIYAEDLLLTVRDNPNINGSNYARLKRHINDAPAVDAAPVVHGRWIEKVDMVESYLADSTEVFFECSVCESPNYGESPYCPNCGAKMDGDWNG